ncbi:MAG: hypothetical protein RLZ77_1799 [Bacteroidota bacterium]
MQQTKLTSMKTIYCFLFLIVTTLSWAQTPCEYVQNISDSIGTYKTTKEYLVHERNFAGNASYLFNSIAVTDGVPVLNVQFIEKSAEFIKAKCLDANSKLFIQLQNGKIVTLMHTQQESCGSLVRDDAGVNNRIMTGTFLFRKDDYQFLQDSPVSFIRIKFGTDTVDYVYKKALKSELDGQLYEPEKYFMLIYPCIVGN